MKRANARVVQIKYCDYVMMPNGNVVLAQHARDLSNMCVLGGIVLPGPWVDPMFYCRSCYRTKPIQVLSSRGKECRTCEYKYAKKNHARKKTPIQYTDTSLGYFSQLGNIPLPASLIQTDDIQTRNDRPIIES